MSSVPASSRMTGLVQRTVLLVVNVGMPKAYTELTTRKLTRKQVSMTHIVLPANKSN